MLRFLLLILLAAPIAAAEPKGIVFPSPPTPTPTPQPPGSALPVSPNTFFVVQSDADLIPVVSGVGKVKFTIEQGPIRVRGIFADGNGQYETRTLTAKTLVFVDPVSVGDAELLMIPVGVKDEASIARQRVTVLDGPRPPPGPGPGPGPKPDGELGLIKASRDGAASVSSPSKSTESAALAEKNRSLASAIAAGGVKDDPAAILAEWRAGNNAAASKAVWGPWGESCSKRLNELYNAGKLPTKAEWIAAFKEIATGLEG